jgi:hypothetical protein
MVGAGAPGGVRLPARRAFAKTENKASDKTKAPRLRAKEVKRLRATVVLQGLSGTTVCERLKHYFHSHAQSAPEQATHNAQSEAKTGTSFSKTYCKNADVNSAISTNPGKLRAKSSAFI